MYVTLNAPAGCQIPTMDQGDVNLNEILKTLAANNTVHWWSIFGKQNGRVIFKIELVKI